jgi:cysteine desulfurase / selenocysteine lyase
VSGAIGLAAALHVLEDIGLETIAARDRALADHAASKLRAVPGLRVLGALSPGRIPVFSFTLEGVDVPTIVQAADAAGIAIRGGDLAALPLLKRFGVTAAARASAYFFNTPAEIDRLVDVLQELRR